MSVPHKVGQAPETEIGAGGENELSGLLTNVEESESKFSKRAISVFEEMNKILSEHLHNILNPEKSDYSGIDPVNLAKS